MDLWRGVVRVVCSSNGLLIKMRANWGSIPRGAGGGGLGLVKRDKYAALVRGKRGPRARTI